MYVFSRILSKAIPKLGLLIIGVLRLGLPPFTYQFYWVAASSLRDGDDFSSG